MSSENVEIIQKRDGKILVQIQNQYSEAWSKEYPQETQLNIIIEDYKNGTGNEFYPEILEAWQNQRKGEEIKDMKIKNFVNKYEEEENFVLGDNPLKIPEIIGKPFSDPFSIFAFKKKEKILRVLDLEGKDLKGLENYGPYSAYCNGNNILFISGGEINNKKYVEKFWKIDLNSLEIECIDMIPRKSHSMIVVPGNYVFIVGGRDKETFYYDIENGNGFCGWKPLNNIRIEPALILVNNILYCFDNVNSNQFTNGISFEKTDLISDKHEWELINTIIPDINFDQKFFGVVQKDNDIIFLGGNIDLVEGNQNGANERKNFKYNIIENKIEESEIPFIEFNLKEKTFLPYNDKVYYIFPDFNKHHPEVIFYQKNKNKIKLVKYESIIEEKIGQRKKINDLPPAKINQINFDQPKADENFNIINKMKNPDVGLEIKINNDINGDDNKDVNIEENNKLNEKEDKKEEDVIKSIKEDEHINSKIIIDIDDRKRISIPNSNELGVDKNVLEENNNQNVNTHNVELNINISENPTISMKELYQKKPDVNLEKEIREFENENKDTENIELLKDKLMYSKVEENINIMQSSGFNLPQEPVIKTPTIDKENQKKNGGNEINDINIQLSGTNNDIKNEPINMEQINVNIEKEFKKKEEELVNPLINTEIKIEEKKDEKPKEIEIKPNIEPINKIEIENFKGKEKEGFNFYVSGIIQGTKQLKAKTDVEKNEEPKIKVEGNVNVPNPEIKEGNIEANENPSIPKVDVKIESKDDKKEKGFCISGVIVGTKEKDPKILKLGPNGNIESKNPQLNKNVEIKGDGPNTMNQESNAEANINVIKPGNDIPEDLKNPNLNIGELKIDGNYARAPPFYADQKNKININNKLNYPSFDESKNFQIEGVQIPNAEIPSAKVDINVNVPENTNENNEKLNAKFNSNIPELVITGTDAKTKTPIKLPDSTNQNDIKPFEINAPKPNVDISIKEENKDSDNKNFKLSGIIGGIKDQNNNKKNNIPSENKSDLIIKGPKLDFNGNIIQSNNEENKEIKNNESNKKEGESKQYFIISGIIPADKTKIKSNNKEEIKLGGNLDINMNLGENKKESENEIKGKKIVLPTVSVKNENFVSSKVDEGEKLNEINVNTDNLKSANVGINGQKMGERTDN